MVASTGAGQAIASQASGVIASQSARGVALMTIGLPGSGKSSLARQFCDQGSDWCWVSTDRIRQQLFGAESIQGPWPLVEQQLLKELVQAFQAEQTVVLDATHARRRQRRRVLMQLRAVGFERVVGLWLDLPVGVCRARTRQRDRVVPAVVIRRMHRYLSAALPSPGEGFSQLWQGRLGENGCLGWRLLTHEHVAVPLLSTLALRRQIAR